MSLLFGFAPGGACHAADVAARAVRSYRTLHLAFSLEDLAVRDRRFAFCGAFPGVAPPDVIRRRIRVEPDFPPFLNGGRPADWRMTAYGANARAVKHK